MSSGEDDKTAPLRPETALVTAGRDTKAEKGFVNPPVFHGSTVLYPTADDLHAHIFRVQIVDLIGHLGPRGQLVRHGRHRLTRILGVLYPLVLSVVVIATANHYLLDVIAGLAVVGLGALVAKLFTAVGRQIWPEHVPGCMASTTPASPV